MMGFLRMLISTALAFLCTAISATAEGHWSDIADRLDGVQSWEELCAIEDCDQFPEGYATFALGSEIYYLPLPQTLQEPVNAAYSVPRGQFYEENDGRVIRSFGYHPVSLRLGYSSSHLLRFFDLDANFPAILRETHGSLLSGASVRLYTASSGSGFRIERFAWLDVSSHDVALSFEEVFPDLLPSFNNDFWLLRYTPAPNDGEPDSYSILSKQPIFNDRLIYGFCKEPLCAFYTANFAEDMGNEKPHIRLLDVWMRDIDSFRCIPEEGEFRCNNAPVAFSEIDEVFERLEMMFGSLKVFPESKGSK